MKKYLAYCRVSTKAQADMDNSLPVQRRIITEYAQRKEFQIVEWYSEASSGFKGKRTEFHKMLERLGDHDIEGVVFHKLDRSSRNMSDFALLDQMVTQHKKKMIVIEGEFDTSRAAGRLAFRNFCNMAVWYSENLSEEVSTKMTEVLRKGYFPSQTPIGYRVGVKGKDPDPKKKYPDEALAPFVKEAFELFATGDYSVRTICDHMREKGMTNSKGGKLRKGIFERMMRNPFYYGMIEWKQKSTNSVTLYQGNHEPLIDKKLFDRIQEVLDGRFQKNKSKHDFTYTKMVRCSCGNFLIPSHHKTHIYLECHNRSCEFKNIREDRLEDQIIILLSKFMLEDDFLQYAKIAIKELSGNIRTDNEAKRKALNMKLAQLDGRLQKINNAVIDGYFEAQEGLAEKNKIIAEKHTLLAELADQEEAKEDVLWKYTDQVLSIFNIIPANFRSLNPVVKRKVLNYLFSNLQLNGQKLLCTAVSAFANLAIVNNWIAAEKMTLNLQPKGKKPLIEAVSTNQKFHLVGEILDGGPTWT